MGIYTPLDGTSGKGGAGGVMTTNGCSRKSTNLGTPSGQIA
jgi:hypothetical protein